MFGIFRPFSLFQPFRAQPLGDDAGYIPASALLLESGDALLLESGDLILMESM